MTQDGDDVLAAAVAAAGRAFGDRLLAAYALGSLAHGGFDPLVSDVDLGLVLSDPIAPGDAAVVAALTAEIKPRRPPLSERLSVFWGTPASLRGAVAGGRFPPYDVLDLVEHGRLLAGRDQREGVPAPGWAALVEGAAEFVVEFLARPDVGANLTRPAALLARGPRSVTKVVLFPVRFLYTARTGLAGTNHEAVAHYRAHHRAGAGVSLASAALGWRTQSPPLGDDAEALLAAGLVPLYHELLDDHEGRLRDLGRAALADRLAASRQQLDELATSP